MEKVCHDCNLLKSEEEFYKNKKYMFKRCIKCDLKKKCIQYQCDCGRYYSYTHKQRHFKSKIHIKRMEELKQMEELL